MRCRAPPGLQKRKATNRFCVTTAGPSDIAESPCEIEQVCNCEEKCVFAICKLHSKNTWGVARVECVAGHMFGLTGCTGGTTLTGCCKRSSLVALTPSSEISALAAPLSMTWQVPGISALSIHWFDRVCALQIRVKSQVEEGRDCFSLGGLNPSTVPEVDLLTGG